ncbi:minichromosome maintenance-related protein [Halocaridina rubra]|uniref:Protein MCM10 homolog n=1 Tax=Halocaridina rubra TaxID=373956 RepID=A0AAN8XBT3_HALRR
MEIEEAVEEYDLDSLTALLDAEDNDEEWNVDNPATDSRQGNSDIENSSQVTGISDVNDIKESSLSNCDIVTEEDLGLLMSDDEKEESQPSTSRKVSSFSKAFSGSKFSRNGNNQSVSDNGKSQIDIDPLEEELRLMEERMKSLKDQLAKKKRLGSKEGETSRQNFTKLTNVAHQSKRTIRTLSGNEEVKFYETYGKEKSHIHTGDTDSEDEEDYRNPFDQKYNSYGREIKKRIAHEATEKSNISHNKKDEIISRVKGASTQNPGWKGVDGSLVALKHNGNIAQTLENDKNAVTDFFSGVRLINPLITQEAMRERMEGRKMVRMSSINLHVRGGDIEGDWVTIGVLISKSDPKTSQKGTQYSIWKLSDLQDCTKTIALFLFSGAHKNLWKHSIGTVIGILNPSIMKDRQGDKSTECLTLSIHDSNKVMIMGSSKDLGWCKGRTKANGFCKSFVNKATCEFCIYHIQREYQKATSKRADLQSSFTRVDPKRRLQDRVLGKDQVFYGGQLFTAASPSNVVKAHNALKAKDLATLSSLKMKLKTKELKEDDKKNSFVLKHMSNSELEAIGRVAQKSENFSEKLLAPTPGARNLLCHMAKEETQKKIEKGEIRSISAKELLNMTHKKILTQKNKIVENKSNLPKSRVSFPPTASPLLGRGMQPGDDVDLEFSPPPSGLDASKSRALSVLKAKGGIQAANPNSIRNATKASDPEFQNKVRKRLNTTSGSDSETSQPKKSKLQEAVISKPGQSKLGSIDVNSEKFRAMLETKSRHTNLVDSVENEALEKYYQVLEKKEMLEEKMASIMEVPTTAYVCIKCKYMALSASNFCREENHPLKAVKVKKRFFECKNCKRRTTSLDKLPRNPCSNCNQNSWQRVSMGKAKAGPKLDSEILSLRGDELKHYSGSSDKVYLHV